MSLALVDDYLKLTPQARKNALEQAIQESASAIMRAAEIFAAMEAARDDTTAIPVHLKTALRSIAAKTMIPEVWTNLEGLARRSVMRLPVEQQKEIVSGKLLPVVRGENTVIALRINEMTPQEVKQVIGDDGVRTPDEQRMLLTKAKPELRVIITTRHPKSRHGVPVVILDGKITNSYEALSVLLPKMGINTTDFAHRCGVSYQAILQRKNEGLTANQLNVLRDLCEDHQLIR